MKFDTIIKEIRSLLRMTQEELAQELNISFCTINRWENGHTKPSRLAQKALRDLCRKYNIEPTNFPTFTKHQ